MKKKVEMQDLGKEQRRLNLKMVHPFLKQDFRLLDKKETKSEKVFRELFGEDEPIELWKLDAIYEYQK